MTGLNLGGWIFIATAWGLILTVTVFCFKRVLGSQGRK